MGARSDDTVSRLPSKTRILRAALIGLLLPVVLVAVLLWFGVLSMPGRSFSGRLPAITPRQQGFARELRKDVEQLAGTIGARSTEEPAGLQAAADYLQAELERAGYAPQRQRYNARGVDCENIEAELRGSRRAHEIVVVGAHYDAVPGTVGADDNASGSATTLALARALRGSKPARTLRFVLFSNEEWPHFQSATMGSAHYANHAAQRKEQIVAMLSLETLGYYSDGAGSQHYPSGLSALYPSTGNFVAFVGNLGSRALVRTTLDAFRRNATFPSEGAALPSALPGVGWSDHWAFWQAGYPAVMVTDTAPFRNPHYHTEKDTPDSLDYERLARVTDGLLAVIAELAQIDLAGHRR